MSLLTIKEAAEIIESTLHTKLPLSYWLRFISNHGREKSNDNPFIWCKMDLIKKDSRYYVEEDNIQKFLEEAVNHEFPLKLINDGYNRNDKPRKTRIVVPDVITTPTVVVEAQPVVSARDAYAKEALLKVCNINNKTDKQKAEAYDTVQLILKLWLTKD